MATRLTTQAIERMIASEEFIEEGLNQFPAETARLNRLSIEPQNESPAETARLARTQPISSTPEASSTVNPLHAYTTYTYGLTLFMLSSAEYEKLQATPANAVSAWNPTYALISSAGRYSSAANATTSGRQAEFNTDFYFENFKMTTVIGLNSQNRGTNAIEMSFTIVEPYGMTLLDRLIDASKSNDIGSKNYLAQPYLLELDFFGASDIGDMTSPIKDLRKRFPIQLIEFKIRATTRGAEYSVKAIPFNHGAYKDSVSAVPVNMEIEATTVGNFFKGTANSGISDQFNTRTAEFREKKFYHGQVENGARMSAARRAHGEPVLDTVSPYTAANFNNALNEWFRVLEKNKDVSELDKVEFNFVGFPVDILSSTVTPPEIPSKNTVLGGRSNSNVAAMDSSNTATVAPTRGRTFGINAGTRIVDVINKVMMSSDYIANQMLDESGSRKRFSDNAWVDFFKVVPQIKELRYDTKRKRYASTIVYHIVYYKYFNAKHPALPYANPNSAVKEYDYIYTGKNTDIIDFNIEFDVAYYTATIGLPNNIAAGNNNDNKLNDDFKDYVILDDTDESNEPNTVPQEVVSATDARGTGTVLTQGQAVIANAMSSIYSNARGDMIQLQMKIIGDPQFIKQDDIYVNPGQVDYDSSLLLSNGSIAMDHSEIFCYVRFLTPTDIDESTGLVTKKSKYAVSKFTGFYKILTVASEFSKGQFTQTLTGVRMMKSKKIINTSERSETTESAAETARLNRTGNNTMRTVTGDSDAGHKLLEANYVPRRSDQFKTPIKMVGPASTGTKGFINPTAVLGIDKNTLLPLTPEQLAARDGQAIRASINRNNR